MSSPQVKGHILPMTGQGGHTGGFSGAVVQACSDCEPGECSDLTALLVRAGAQGPNLISSGSQVCFVAGDSLFSSFAEDRRAVAGHSDCVLMTQLWDNRSIHTLPHP